MEAPHRSASVDTKKRCTLNDARFIPLVTKNTLMAAGCRAVNGLFLFHRIFTAMVRKFV